MPDEAASVRSPVVLLAEDEPLVRILAEDTLVQAGFSVCAAETADQALELLRQGLVVDLLVTDICMPGTLDGIDLAKAVIASLPDLPIIVTSGYTDRGDDLNGLLPIIAFIPKPYDPSRLMSLAAGLVARRRNESVN